MKRSIALLFVLLAGCGSAGALKPAPGKALPVAPLGARVTPTPEKLLRRSEERRSDEFDLPPERFISNLPVTPDLFRGPSSCVRSTYRGRTAMDAGTSLA